MQDQKGYHVVIVLLSFHNSEQVEAYMATLQRKDAQYVETKAYTELMEIVDDTHWGIILGSPGDGKTSMAVHLMFHYKSLGYEPVYVKTPEDWKQNVYGIRSKGKTAKQFVVVDDAFGTTSVDERNVSEWLAILEMIEMNVDDRDGSLLVVFTNRRYVYYDVVSKLGKFKKFRKSSIVDLTERRWTLSEQEKCSIFENMCRNNNVENTYNITDFEYIEPPYGYPSLVESFCGNAFYRTNGLSFFQNPIKLVSSQIANFKENDRTKYCILLFLLFKNNRLEQRYLQNQKHNLTDEDKVIIHNAGISNELACTDIKRSINGLLNNFIGENNDGSLRFANRCVMNAVAFMYIQDHTMHAIEELDFEHLVEFTIYPGSKCNSRENKIELPENCVDALVKRITKEILRGNIFAACRHQAWCNKTFVSRWLTYVVNCFSSKDNTGRSCANSLALPVELVTMISDTLLEPLIVMKRKLAVLALLQNDTMLNNMKHASSLDNILSYALQLACSSSGNEEIVRTLLSKGANGTSCDSHGRILLMLALQDVQESTYARLLLKEKQLIPKHKDENGKGYFHYLVNSGASEESFREFCGLLLSVGEDINEEDKYVQSPLFQCVENAESLNSEDLGFGRFKILIEKGADAMSKDKKGRNLVLHVLKHIKRNDICLRYLQYLHELHVDFNATDCYGRSAIHYLVLRAVDSGHRCRNVDSFNSILLFLAGKTKVQLCASDMNGINPLMLGLEFCPEYELVEILLQTAVAHHKDFDGKGYFHYLVKSRASARRFAALCNSLLALGEDIDSKDNHEIPALFLCNDLLDISVAIERLQIMVSLGANTNIRDKHGKNIILLTVEKRAGKQRCVDFLECCRENGADFRATDKDGKNVIHYFIFRIGLLGLFLDKSCCNNTFQYLYKHATAHVTSLDNNGRSPLMMALKDCIDFSFMNDLLQHIVPKQSDADGRGYFHYLARSCGSQKMFERICSFLVQQGEDVNVTDKLGRTPVFECVTNRMRIDACLSNMQILQECGANLNITDKNGTNLVMWMLKNLVVSNDLECVLQIIDFLTSEISIDEQEDNYKRNVFHYLLMAEIPLAAMGNAKLTRNLFNDIGEFLKSKMSVNVTPVNSLVST